MAYFPGIQSQSDFSKIDIHSFLVFFFNVISQQKDSWEEYKKGQRGDCRSKKYYILLSI